MRNQKLIATRRQKELSALALSELSGISEMRIYAIERGRARVRKAEAISLAGALGVPVEVLFARPASGASR